MKIKRIFHRVFLILLLLANLCLQNGFSQNTFPAYLDSAKANHRELISLKTNRQSILLDEQMILATNRSPKVYLSSDYLFAPFLNNNGKFISNDPDIKAIGYDAALSDGGLYALMINAEMPIFNQKQVQNLSGMNSLELSKIETQIQLLELELSHALAQQYFDVLLKQAMVDNLKDNIEVLANQLEVVSLLYQHGLYRYLDYKLMEVALKTDSITLENALTEYKLSLSQLKTACSIKNNQDVQLENYEPLQKSMTVSPSIFLKTFEEDSLSAEWQNKLFNDQYRPNVTGFANSGLNSTSIPNMGRHFGMSAGFHLIYTLFDGNKKKINEQQQRLAINEAFQQKTLKSTELKSRREAYKKAIAQARTSLQHDYEVLKNYNDLQEIYTEELKTAQVSTIDFLNFLQQYNSFKQTMNEHSISLNQLINEYNYWNN
ncbi:MAG: TolC family protein [Prolixibacteraceae bacterium]